MLQLWSAVIIFTLVHALPSTKVRPWLIERLGRGGFMGAYSLLSLALFIWLFIAFWAAEHSGGWLITSPWLRFVSAGLMLPVFLFLGASALQKNAVLLTGETVLSRPGAVTGILRITRHPFLWALALWSLVHIVNNFDPPGLLLFGYFLLLSAGGTWPIDRRRAHLIEDKQWQQVLAQTSNVPFVAILQGRQSLLAALREIGWLPLLTGFVLWALVLHFHEDFFGLPVFY